MHDQDSRAVARRFYEELIARGSLAILDEVTAPDLRFHAAFPGQPPGSAGLRHALLTLRSAFPDLACELVEMICENGKAVARFTVSGTHQGTFMGMSATGRAFRIEEVMIATLRGGRVTELWNLADRLSLRQQLGAVAGP
jgi:steroid delta-isomerase-like uncharacterized protein